MIARLVPGGRNQDLLAKVVELGIGKVVQELLEGEAEEHLGRGYYQRKDEESQEGYRNGYKHGKLKTAEGRIEVEKPQISDAPERFHSKLWNHIKGNTEVLEHIAVEMFARGCSTRDVEEVLKDEKGKLLLSKSSISVLSERLWEGYEEFCKQDLSEYRMAYLFADAVYEAMRVYKTVKEGILVCWGILEDGRKILLGMRLGNKESYQDWLDFFRDLRKRGLGDPVLGTTDGAPGLMRAYEECFPKSYRQRCLVHKKKNILGKVPQEDAAEVKSWLDTVYYAPDIETGREDAKLFIKRYERLYPSAVESFKDDLEASLNHLRCPVRHRRSISTTNLVERSFGEEKRRSKVLPRFFTEKSCLKLAFASLIRASRSWSRVRIDHREREQLMELRYELGQLPRPEITSLSRRGSPVGVGKREKVLVRDR